MLLVNQPMFNDFNKGSQMGEDGAAHKDGDLLDNLDSSMPGLENIFGIIFVSFQEIPN